MQNSETPVQIIRLTIEIEDITTLLAHEPSQDVICDFVDGSAFGHAIGIGIRSISGWWTVGHIMANNRTVSYYQYFPYILH